MFWRADAGTQSILGGQMTTATLKEKINLSHAKALKRAREMMKVTRIEMARNLISVWKLLKNTRKEVQL
jgi:hypothetical protein